MPRKRQISSSPEEVSEEEELSDVPSEQEMDVDDEEEVEEEEEEEEEDELEEEEEEEEDDDGEFENQSEDEPPATSDDEEASDATPLPPVPAPTTTSKGRVSRKPAQPVPPPPAPAVSTRPARGNTRPDPPEQPKIKLKLTVAREPQEVMGEIKVENPPKDIKFNVKDKVDTAKKGAKETTGRAVFTMRATKNAPPAPAVVQKADLVLPKAADRGKGKQPVVQEDDDEESSSSVLEEDEEDMSDVDEDDIPGGTEMDIDDEEEEEEEEDYEDTERSRTGTPMDSSRLTKRQQAKFNESLRPHSLMALPNGTPLQFFSLSLPFLFPYSHLPILSIPSNRG